MGSLFSSQGYVNVLTASAAELSELLVKGCIRSVDLVNLYLAQVERHNKKGACLNAMISTALREKLIRVAEKLDHERANKGIRTPLHGIPVIIKVRTHFKILSSASYLTLKHYNADYDGHLG